MMQGQRRCLKDYQGEHWPIMPPELTLDFLGHKRTAPCQVLLIMNGFLASSTRTVLALGRMAGAGGPSSSSLLLMEFLQG